jgi:ADP-heptose:LPS heptosyltransferase
MAVPERKILILSLQGIGNAILSLALAAAVKSIHPNSPITLLVQNAGTGKICSHHPAIDHVLDADRAKFALLANLRREKYDLAIFSFPSGLRSHILAYAAGIPSRIGHRIYGKPAFQLTMEIQAVEGVHDLDQNWAIAKRLGVTQALDDFWPPLSDIPAQYVARAKDYLAISGLDPAARYIGIHTGSDPKFVEKRYPPESFARVAEILYEKTGLPAIVFDGAAEPGTGMRVVRAGKTPVHALNGWGDLADAWGLMSVCDLFVSNDSGLMNLAEASGVPTVGIFGPSEVHRTRPYKGQTVVSDWNCAPCYSLDKYPGCQFVDRHCLEAIPPAAVVDAAMKVLRS